MRQYVLSTTVVSDARYGSIRCAMSAFPLGNMLYSDTVLSYN